MHASLRNLALSAFILTVLAIGVAGCAPNGPVWVSEQNAYTTKTIETVFDAADTSRLTDRSTKDAAALRHDALAALRKSGADASGVADMLTRTFEPETRGVPVYVELASVDGTAAVIVVEAAGPKSGTLDSKRMWVLNVDGDVIFARSR